MEQEPRTCEKIPQLLLKYANAAAFAVSVSQSSREVGAADANGMQPRARKRSSNRAKCDSNATRQDLNAAVSAADGDDTHACKLLVHVQGKVNVVYCISSLVSAPSLAYLTYNSQASQGLSPRLPPILVLPVRAIHVLGTIHSRHNAKCVTLASWQRGSNNRNIERLWRDPCTIAQFTVADRSKWP